MEVKLPGHKHRHPDTLEKATKACTLINGGMRVVDVAKRFKVTRARVYQWVKLVVTYGHEKN